MRVPRLYGGQVKWTADQERAHFRLVWQYGPERAKAIVEGRDPATEMDLARWRTLGKRKPK